MQTRIALTVSMRYTLLFLAAAAVSGVGQDSKVFLFN
jgi:hypothetical protein